MFRKISPSEDNIEMYVKKKVKKIFQHCFDKEQKVEGINDLIAYYAWIKKKNRI